jgi:hypothetical protein
MSAHVATARRARIRERLCWTAMACGNACVLAIARHLEPAAPGVGTHVQLGLPPCGFLAATGLPCPACGLTTAFAHMVRLNLLDAAHVHPVGVALFMVVVASLMTCGLAAGLGWPLEDTLKRLRLARMAAIICLAAVLSWFARLLALLSA